MKKHTVVIEGGQLGAALAIALAFTRCGLSEPGWFMRRDGRAQVYAYADDADKGARGRWVRECKSTGLNVAPAPWEREAKSKSEAKRLAVQRGAS